MDTPRLPKLKARKIDGHKGTFGTVGIFGGSNGDAQSQQPRMIGAPALVAMAANRAGCGLIKIAAPDSILSAVLTLAPMATGFPYISEEEQSAVLDRMSMECDVLVVGPGLGTGADIQRFIASVTTLTADNQCKYLVLDADALNALCTLEPFPTRFTLPTILTPHPGEAQRLLDALDIDHNPAGNASQRSLACRSIAERLHCIVVLKGMHTVVSDGHREWVCQHGHPCLSTGGTGDVLAGMIGSLVAQCLNNPDVDDFGVACIAVDTHARCGEVWSQRHNADAGLDPRDLMPLIPELLQRFRNLPLPR
tara:strand:- start:7210 stop:8133 length:924 start_codon:yes stop_codon:yes gene_type:complete